jgi:hypothetical protein
VTSGNRNSKDTCAGPDNTQTKHVPSSMHSMPCACRQRGTQTQTQYLWLRRQCAGLGLYSLGLGGGAGILRHRQKNTAHSTQHTAHTARLDQPGLAKTRTLEGNASAPTTKSGGAGVLAALKCVHCAQVADLAKHTRAYLVLCHPRCCLRLHDFLHGSGRDGILDQSMHMQRNNRASASMQAP